MFTRLGKIALVALAAAIGVASTAQAQTNILFVVDASGSMKKKVDGAKTRMAVAKDVLGQALADIPADARLGLMAYGHRNAGDCKDIELLSPIGSEDAAIIAGEIAALTPKGETPIAGAITKAAKSFAALKGQQNTVVLVTDGIEECDGDPCAAAKAVHDAGLDLKVSIVGFTLSAKDRAAIECVARETGGTYYDAKNGAALSQALAEVQKEAVAPEPAPPPAPKPAPVDPRKNLLAKDNGGEILAAPNDVWLKTVDGAENYDYWLHTTEEGVYGFKDGQAATFDTFAQFINQTDARTAKEIELLAGDEGPTGAFRSITTCTFENVKLLKALYQECRFPAVTAKFLKVKIVSDFAGGDQAYATEFKLLGELSGEGASPTPKPTKSTAIDLLSAKNGGEILAAPNDVWLKTVDGAENYDYWLHTTEEGVYGFKDGQAATFDTFAQFINQTDARTAKEIELLAGDEGPTGAFRSITTCTFENVKLLKALYQECRFPAVTAKFLKVKIVSDFAGGDQAYATEFKLLGELSGEGASPTPKPAKSTAIDLLSAKNGGEILAAPNDVWLKTVDGAENYDYWLHTTEEGVYGFKDGQAATFDTFAQFINQTDARTAKEIELLAGDEGPTGAFRSITTCTFENVKLLKALYQECRFPAVTAKFLKVKIVSDFAGGDEAYATEFKLLGELSGEGASPTPKPAKSTAIDLLSAKNGGEILAAPNDVWLKTVDGAENYDYWLHTTEEGVYGFKDGQAATFDTFAQFINQTDARTAKEIELLAGDEGPTGAFRSITTCTFENVKLLKALYQECRFPAVTAKFLKVKIVSDFAGGDEAYATEFKLLGELSGEGASPTPKPTKSTAIDLLSAKNGGEILAAPNDVWLKTVDGAENYDYWLHTTEEGVYGFKDGQAATFDTFAQFINQTDARTAKEIELLAGDEGPTGAFRSITTCTFENVKLLKALYQECRFPAVTAKFLKVKIVSDFAGGDEAYATEFKLLGELSGEGASPTPKPTKSTAIDLLSAKNGGEILAAPNDVWLKTVDGAENYDYWLNVNQEGVYGFKDGQAATFDTFAQFINQTDARTAKEIELLAGDEGPTGAFRSITTCTFENVKLLKALYQECRFPAVTAKFLKVKIISNFNGGDQAYATEFKLMGQPVP